MRISIRQFFISLLLLIYVSVLFGQDEFAIQKIYFEGNKSLSESILKKQLNLELHSFPKRLLFWKEPERYTDEHLYQEADRLERFYQTEGFLKAQVRFEKKILKKTKDIDVVFYIKENEPVVVQDIRYILMTETRDDKKAIDSLLQHQIHELPLRTGARFRDQEILEQRREIIRLLMNDGYPSPEVQYRITLNHHQADVEYIVYSGPKGVFHDIQILGNQYISPEIIKKQLSIDMGDTFREEALEKNQKRVQQLGVFEYVSIRQRPDPNAGKLILDIQVRELPRWSVKTGIGYGLDERFRLSATLRRQPFFGHARYATLYLKYSRLEPYHVDLNITQPALFTPNSTLFLNPFARKEIEKAYELQRWGTGMTFQQGLSPESRIFVNYTFERNQLKLDEDVTESFIPDYSYYNKSKISLGFSTDYASPLFFPDQGWHVSCITTFSGLPGSRYHYLSGLSEFRKYQRFTDRLVLAGKIKAGIMKDIMNDKTTPIEERFYAGGSNSVRGFLRNELGPENEKGIPIGGNSYLEASLELRHRIIYDFYGTLFMDTGNVWSSYHGMNVYTLAWSPGMGIRYNTPIGPVRFDIAYPLHEPDGQLRFHLSFGQAF
jgi:outer membrane protein insertion porin family